MKVMKGKMRQVLALLLIVAMVVTTIQISPVQAQAAKKGNSMTTYDGDGYTVTFKVTSQWSGAFNADVTITNTSDKVIDNWALGFAMPYEITKIWNGVIHSKDNGLYVIKNADSNQDIAVGKSVTFGFSAKADGELVLPSTYELLCYEEIVAEGAYEVSFKTTSDWKSAFNGEIRIKNISEVTIEDWKLEFDFDHKIDRFWTAEIIKQEGNHYSIKNAGYNANIKPGETVVFGFSGNPGNVVTAPINYKLMQISTKPVIEYIELEDGRIEKNYLERAIYPKLLMDGKTIDNVKLSDDFDGDGLTLAQEYEYDTNPFLKDSDEDGLDDYVEISLYGTNPNYWDTDDDEMSDGTEISCGLNPLVKDSDGNGILDGDEVVRQQVRLDGFETNTLDEVGTLPSVIIEGKGDYSAKLNAVKIENDKAILDINCMVGTPFDFVHSKELTFESSELTFEISDELLKKNLLKDLAVAWYNEEENALELLDTTYDEEKLTVSANVDHYSKYMVVNVLQYFFDIDWENEGSKIESGKADVIFVVDTTGSMYDEIQNVKNNINQFVSELEENKVDIRLGLVEYRDIYADGTGSTKSYDWYTSVSSFKDKLGALGVGGGGDGPESVVDALNCAQNMKFRTGVKKYIIVITDANYKNGITGDPLVTMSDKIEQLVSSEIVTSVVTSTYYYSTYSNLSNQTDGVLANIYENFAVALRPLIEKMGIQVNDGCWIRLSNGSVVRLDKDPALGDESVDTDNDGIPDLIELKSFYNVSAFNPYTGQLQLIDTWSFYSNPVKKDTDGDGLSDLDDLNPREFDTVITSETDEKIAFNTGREWKKVKCTSFDYLDNFFQMVDGHVDNAIPLEEFRIIVGNVESNKSEYFNLDELIIIGLLNNEGSKLYMHDKSKYTKETVFQTLANRESKYYKHSGILWWENWKEVEKGTDGGFFKGTVLSEADINFSWKIYNVCDVYSVLNSLVKIGAVVISIIVVAEATPVVLANIQGLTYYVKTFGVLEGLKMYTYLGVNNLPNSVITWVQWDVADGDSSLDDIAIGISEQQTNKKLYDYLSRAENTSEDKNLLLDANFAQKTYNNVFSKEGIEKYSKLAGKEIRTVNDLANAIKSGIINPKDLPIEYIVRDENILILNTRTSHALMQAGIAREQWYGINRTGKELYERLLTGQLTRNNLTSAGIEIVRPSGGN